MSRRARQRQWAQPQPETKIDLGQAEVEIDPIEDDTKYIKTILAAAMSYDMKLSNAFVQSLPKWLQDLLPNIESGIESREAKVARERDAYREQVSFLVDKNHELTEAHRKDMDETVRVYEKFIADLVQMNANETAQLRDAVKHMRASAKAIVTYGDRAVEALDQVELEAKAS
jgi:hypothetical protein